MTVSLIPYMLPHKQAKGEAAELGVKVDDVDAESSHHNTYPHSIRSEMQSLRSMGKRSSHSIHSCYHGVDSNLILSD